MTSPTAKIEKKLVNFLVPRIPKWIKGHHLTLMSLPISIGIALSGYAAAQNNLNWLWLMSFLIFSQWFTDSLDGSLGRHRKAGIPRWGFYMDHMLDFVFATSILLGYSFLFNFPQNNLILLFIPVISAFMISSYLLYGATQQFKITFLGLGPTELRILTIIFNTCLIYLGTSFVEKALVPALIISILGLTLVIFQTQRRIWLLEKSDPLE